MTAGPAIATLTGGCVDADIRLRVGLDSGGTSNVVDAGFGSSPDALSGVSDTSPGVMNTGSPCAAPAQDAPALGLDFSNNLIASPAPPGQLSPQNAPQIVVFGFDDVENTDGVAFVNGFLGSVTNPDSSQGGFNMNPNACYAQSSLYACGDGSLAGNLSLVTKLMPDFGNHTLDHLEPDSQWSGIPTQYQDPNTGGWAQTATGLGPGVVMDEQTWLKIIGVNDAELKKLYGVSAVSGLRAPRLEINDNGLQAIKAANYTYDEDLEEVLPAGYVQAAVAVNTANQQGFNFIPWPYTLDNGSPGIWTQQVLGDKKWVGVNYPNGVWEIPVYHVYLPTAGGVGLAVAYQMLAADQDCTIPTPSPHAPSSTEHCYLTDGEVIPGQAITETPAYDFDMFIYSRMKKDQWLATMEHTFLMRYYGNRAPLTYAAHPIEYSSAYDNLVLTQANSYGYANAVNYNTYVDRRAAMTAFRDWIKVNPTLRKDTYFLSEKQLAEYMKNPFDKTGAPVMPDAVASPDSNGLFTRVVWSGPGATINVVSGNSADIVFSVASVGAPPVRLSAGLKAGSLSGLSHIDIKYNTQVPFRIRLLTRDGSSTTALLAGVGGDRLARIRIKDFFPGPEATAAQVATSQLVDKTYMANVVGIAFESAATLVTGA